MTFERPWYLLALLLALVPAGLVLSRYVSSKRTLFPAASYLFRQDRRPLARLRSRQILTSLIRMAIVGCLAIGFAGPMLSVGEGGKSGSRRPPHFLLMIDVGAGMAAAEPGESSLMEKGRKLLLERVAAFPDDAVVGLLACPGEAGGQWLTKGQALESIRTLPHGWGECRPSQTLAGAERLLSAASALLVVTRAQRRAEEIRKAAPNGLRSTAEIEVLPVPAKVSNLALAGLTRQGDSLLALVQNHSGHEARARLRLVCREALREDVLEVPPGATSTWQLTLDSSLPDGLCSVAVQDDQFPPDDSAWFELERRAQTTVMLVEGTPTADWGSAPSALLGAAIKASGKAIRLVRLAQQELSYSSLMLADILVFLDPQTMPSYLEQGLLDFVRNGGKAWFLVGDNMTRWPADNLLLPGATFRTCAAVEEHPFRLEWLDRSDPSLRLLSGLPEAALATWTSLRHAAVTFVQAGAQVIARFGDSVPAMLRIRSGSGQIVLWSLVPDDRNGVFPFHPLFPLTVASLLADLVPPPAVIRTVPECPAGRPCKVTGEDPGSTAPQSFRPGTTYQSWTVAEAQVAGSLSGEIVCPVPGPYFSVERGARRLAFACVVPEPERVFDQGATEEARSAGETAGKTSPRAPYRSAGPYLLLAALLLIFAELWLVSGRRPAVHQSSGSS
jgi:hypothetical protein